MNYFFNFKTLVFTVVLALSTFSLNAQWNDNFFQVENDDAFYLDRGTFITIVGAGITPQGIGEAPLGSGLLVLMAAGAGYAVSRRRRSLRKGTMFLLALAMLLGFTQCRKKLDTINDVTTGKVHITLRVENDSRIVVDTTNAATNGYAAVSFENGDIMYVGYNKTYVGSLTYNGTNFTGDIDIAVTVPDEPLYFYFLGGKGFTPTFSGNVATLDISDQVLKYPVINFAHSVEVYPSSTGDYTARLLNKCAIVKFHVTKPAGYDQAGTCITGMNNLVTVNFDHTAADTDDGLTYSQVNYGAITLPTKTGNVWAILLPQGELSEGGDMSVFSGRHKGIRPTINAIAANDYISTPYELNLNTEFQPTGALSGLFKVNAEGKMVRFAKGNLQATTTDGWATWTWSFRNNQYEYSVANNTTVGDNYSASSVVNHFGWGTSGYNVRGTESNYYYKPNMTYSNESNYGPDPWSTYSLTGAYAKADWGYNRITNNGYYQWRCLTQEEWQYLKENHTQRWVKVNANSTRYYGVLVLPYGSTTTVENKASLSLDQWTALENEGAILLIIDGYRAGTSTHLNKVTDVDNHGNYWTSSSYPSSNTVYSISSVWFNANIQGPGTGQPQRIGMSVRLVCE